MKRIILITTFIIISLIAKSQSLSLAVIPTAGNFSENESSLSWTMGETAIATLEKDAHLTEGFQQGMLDAYHTDSISFFAKRIDEETVELMWQTFGELKTEGFYVQRKKADEFEFQNISYQKATNRNLKDAIYFFEDFNDFVEDATYRIVVKTTDESERQTPERLIEGVELIQLTSVYPNPTPGAITVSFETKNLESEKEIQVSIIDAAGNMVMAGESHFIMSDSDIRFNQTEQLPNGQYYVVVTNERQLIGRLPFIKINK